MAQRRALEGKLGRYKLLRLLGFGGMGEVFEAIDTNNQRRVAIKFIAAVDALRPDARIRFVREARAAGHLSHPNIVAVYDIGQVSGTLYIVMEYVRGLPLTSFVTPSSLPLKSKLSIVAQAADALGHAHSRGVIHRDVKPANMIVTDGELVRVL